MVFSLYIMYTNQTNNIMNEVGSKINVTAITNSCRQLNVSELIDLLRMDINKFWSWGSHAYTIDNKRNCRMFRMAVNGHHHKGHVYIFLNGSDLFDVYLTTKMGTIKKVLTDLYNDQIVDVIDKEIEYISDYVR